MLKEMTFGQYYPTDSFIHILDPRTKLSATMLYIISLFLVNNIWGYILAALFLAWCIAVSRVPATYIAKGLKPVFMLMAISVIFNLFLTGGEPVLVQWGILRVTGPGVRQACYMALRLVFLVMGSALMTYTTT